jgi:branched-chain amino acid transport system permease protein
MVRKTFLGLGLLLVIILIPYLTSTYIVNLLSLAGVYVILTLGLNIALGFGGQISAAQAAFWGIGAYISALMTTKLALSFWIAYPTAILGAAFMGLVIALPTLRLKGFYLAMATIGFQEITTLVFNNWRQVTAGVDGISSIPRPAIGSWVFTNIHYFYFLWAMVLIAIILSAFLENSRIGRALKALRDNELAAEVVGIDVQRIKTLAFMLSAAFGGAAGSLYAHFARYISPDVFTFSASTLVIAMLIIGGVGTVPGAVIGALLLTVLPEALRFLKNYYMVIYGLGTVLIIIFAPSGLVGLMSGFAEKIARWYIDAHHLRHGG